MIAKLIRKWLKLDENDAEIEKIHKRTRKQIHKTVVVLNECGKMDRQIMQKTTTYFIAKAAGVI